MNATSHELEIHLFAAEIETESFIILADASDSSDFSCSLTFCTTARTTCHDPLWDYRDSAVVVFNNERYLSYCAESLDCQVNEKNILGLNVYAENESGFEMIEENVFLFEITQQDYDSAIILE